MASDEQQDVFRSEIPGGTMLGKFEVLRRIATGGMAEIYLARLRGRAGFEKLVVIKRVLPAAAGNPRFIQMFLDEARLVASLQHPNIADVYEVGEHEGAPFFAMEHVHGQDVRTIRKAASERNQGVPLRVSLAIVHATATALDYAHGRRDPEGVNLNLVHRDVSPSNILVSYEGAIKLIDFGVARVTGQSHTTQSGTVRGKCPYMSPEQCRGMLLDQRSDLFSLGVVLYELTTGRRPFMGASDFEVMDRIVNHDAERAGVVTQGYPPALERIVMKLLMRNRELRYQTGEELLHDLDAFLDANHLWVPPKKLSRYMRTLFSERVIAWERATQGDTDTFAEHVALAMEQPAQDTAPTPVVVMRLAQEIELVARDDDASFAQVYRADDPNDPLRAILQANEGIGSGLGDDSVIRGVSSETFSSRTEESSPPALGGDTITERTGEPDVFEAAAPAPGDTVTTPWDAPPRPDTVTQQGGTNFDHSTTVRAETAEYASVIRASKADIPTRADTAPTASATPPSTGTPVMAAAPPAPTARADSAVSTASVPRYAEASRPTARAEGSRPTPRALERTFRNTMKVTPRPMSGVGTRAAAARSRNRLLWIFALLVVLIAAAGLAVMMLH
jgi:serine/threonine protein kinase